MLPFSYLHKTTHVWKPLTTGALCTKIEDVSCAASVITSHFALIGDALLWTMHIIHLNVQTVSIAVLLPDVAAVHLHDNLHDCSCIQAQ